jgi:hypothetical protein
MVRTLTGLIAAAAVVGVVVVSQSAGGSPKLPPGSPQVTSMFAGIPQHGQALGNPDAPVTLFEFADLKCPICRAYTFDAFPVLVKKYVMTGKLRIVFQPQTFVGAPPGDSERAARFALAAARQNRLWQFAELWYINQRNEGVAYATDAYVQWIASGVSGLDVGRALTERTSSQVSQELREASGLFNTGHFPGTPGFALGRTGQPLRPLPATTQPSQFIGPIEQLLRARGA